MGRISNFYNKISVADKNVFILIMTLIPFILGMGISVYKSSDMNFFGTAINISGSQRMRTMLIANFSQKLGTSYSENNQEAVESTRSLLKIEVPKYQKYMHALVHGDPDIDLEKNKYDRIVLEINKLLPLANEYIEKANNVIKDSSDIESIDYIVDTSLELKNKIHLVVELFEKQYDKEVKIQRNIDITIIIISILLTSFGLFMTRKIKRNEKYANFDYLTGLKNRSVIYEDLKGKDAKNYSAYFIDLDKFKLVNDTFGHLIGDEVLIQAANRLQKIFNPNSVYRYGGDEFLVLRESKDNNEDNLFNENISKQIKKEMEQPFIDSKGREHNLSFSLGVVTKEVGLESFEELIDFSDDLMYDSKNFQSKIVMCDTKEKADYRLKLKSDINKSIDNSEILAYFQPIYDFDKNFRGFETLARWNHKGKIIEPLNFIPLLTRNGLIDDLDLYMIKHLGKVYQEFFSKNAVTRDLYYSINITKETFHNFSKNQVLRVLDSLSIPNDKIIIEVLEDVIIDDSVIDKLKIIHDKGFKIAIDDFSSGSTSLDSLKIKYVNLIKIDKKITDELVGNKYNINLLNNLVHLIHSLGKIVIVEGVETKEQFDLLNELNVDLIQGYYLSKPLAPNDLKKIISNE